MANHHTLSPSAQGDRDEIWTYKLNHWGTALTECYVGPLKQQIEVVAAQLRGASGAKNIPPAPISGSIV
jgi:plasmid stabilization system protein ParE